VDADSGVARPHVATAHFQFYSRGEDGVHWRLLSANNRDSGQSGSSFADVASCRSALDELLKLLDMLKPSYSLVAGRRWEWRLTLDDVVLARSSRGFDRRLRCMAASEWFVRTAPVAVISSGVRIARNRLSNAALDISRPFALPPQQRYPANLPLPGGNPGVRGGTQSGTANGRREGG
jgi:hypothetical protein